MMAEQALGAGRTTRRRVVFGLFDADGWAWATVRAVFWFTLIIFMLGYLPDRAYYFTVNKTLEAGVNVWYPVNLCPPTNDRLPCPVPTGAILPWEVAPGDLALPDGRMQGSLVQSGSKLLYVGGSNGTVAQESVMQTTLTGDGNISAWTYTASMPAARARAAVAVVGGVVYVMGGTDASGAPTDTVFAGTADLATGEVTAWAAADDLKLPAPRTGASVVVVGDGLLLLGGDGGSGATTSVWKSKINITTGKLEKWVELTSLPEPRVDAAAYQIGDFVYVYGGRDANGPTATVLRAALFKDPGADATAEEKARVGTIDSWAIGQGATNLPGPVDGGAGFTANGNLYLVGGEGGGVTGRLLWATPNAQGVILGWHELAPTNLPPNLGWRDTSALASGPHAFIAGGKTTEGVTRAVARASLAPQPPFLQVGLVGITIPALGIPGEVGQQLGYLAAAGVGTVNFILLILIGVAFAHPERTRGILARVTRRRRRTA